jgi:hypothetical protein
MMFFKEGSSFSSLISLLVFKMRFVDFSIKPSKITLETQSVWLPVIPVRLPKRCSNARKQVCFGFCFSLFLFFPTSLLSSAFSLSVPLFLLGASICKSCFFEQLEEEVHQTIINNKLFTKGQKVAIGASGGKGFVCSFLHPLFSSLSF